MAVSSADLVLAKAVWVLARTSAVGVPIQATGVGALSLHARLMVTHPNTTSAVVRLNRIY